eukprot:3935464-Rhodomonas_salina.1
MLRANDDIIRSRRLHSTVLTLSDVRNAVSRFHHANEKFFQNQKCFQLAMANETYSKIRASWMLFSDLVLQMEGDEKKAASVEHYDKIISTLEIIFPEKYVPMQLVPAILQDTVEGKPNVEYRDEYSFTKEQTPQNIRVRKMLSTMGSLDYSIFPKNPSIAIERNFREEDTGGRDANSGGRGEEA